jgi:two-component system cell cycle response regulator DivK
MGQSHAVIIDDNNRNRQVLGQLLLNQGITHTGISDPNQISSVLENVAQVNVIFLDLEMPGLNGYDVFEKLKSVSDLEAVPIVAYTVHVSEMNTAYQHGFHSFIPKPLDPDRFPDQITRILNGERVWERA